MTPDRSAVLENMIKNTYPLLLEDKYNYFVHSSKVLQASHILTKTKRLKILKSMVKMFDNFILQFVKEILDPTNTIPDSAERTLLDIILWGRGVFLEFFSTVQYNESLEEIWKDINKSDVGLCDITEYCISYCLATNNKKPDFLYDWVLSKDKINVRWYRIVEIDVDINHLKLPESKDMFLKIKRKSVKHSKYIEEQFNEKIKRHYKSITGLEKLTS
jgi:hypothetical protein